MIHDATVRDIFCDKQQFSLTLFYHQERQNVRSHVASLGQPHSCNNYEEGGVPHNYGHHLHSNIPSSTSESTYNQVTQRDYGDLAGAIWDYVDR